MAAKELPTLLPEIIQKIALFLPLSDVGKCMQVCKQWKVSILAIMIIRMKMIVIKLMIIMVMETINVLLLKTFSVQIFNILRFVIQM